MFASSHSHRDRKPKYLSKFSTKQGGDGKRWPLTPFPFLYIYIYTYTYIYGGYLGLLDEGAGHYHAKTSTHARKSTRTRAHTHARTHTITHTTSTHSG